MGENQGLAPPVAAVDDLPLGKIPDTHFEEQLVLLPTHCHIRDLTALGRLCDLRREFRERKGRENGVQRGRTDRLGN